MTVMTNVSSKSKGNWQIAYEEYQPNNSCSDSYDGVELSSRKNISRYNNRSFQSRIEHFLLSFVNITVVLDTSYVRAELNYNLYTRTKIYRFPSWIRQAN